MCSLACRRARSLVVLGAAVAAVGVVPAGASASSWFGSSLVHEPSNSLPAHGCFHQDPLLRCTRVGVYYPGTSGRVRAPKSGVIVRFRVRSGGPGRVTFRLARVRNLDLRNESGQARGVGRGPTVNVKGHGFDEANPVESFPARLRVRKGDWIAIDSVSTSALYCTDGSTYQLLYKPVLGGLFADNQSSDDCQLLVQAVIR